MHSPRLLLTAALLTILGLPARAQVTLDLKALEQPHGAAPAPKTVAPSPSAQQQPKPKSADKVQPKKLSRKEAAERRKSEAAEHKKGPPAQAPAEGAKPPAAATAAKPPPAVLPSGPPPEVRLSPMLPEPAPPPAPAKPKSDTPIIAEDAGGIATPISDGVRVTFDGGRAELSPASEAGIKQFAAAAPKSDAASFNVLGFAAGSPEDPSTPRRLSLSRALAVRSVLMAQGVPSTHIYVRALGPASEGEPPDRVDVTLSGGNAP